MAPPLHVSVSWDGASHPSAVRKLGACMLFMLLNKALHLTVSKSFPQGSWCMAYGKILCDAVTHRRVNK